MTMMRVTNSIICISCTSLWNSSSRMYHYHVCHELIIGESHNFDHLHIGAPFSNFTREYMTIMCVTNSIIGVCVTNSIICISCASLSNSTRNILNTMSVTNTIIGVCVTNSIICVSCLSLSNFTSRTYDYNVCHENHHLCVCVVKGPHILIT